MYDKFSSTFYHALVNKFNSNIIQLNDQSKR